MSNYYKQPFVSKKIEFYAQRFYRKFDNPSAFQSCYHSLDNQYSQKIGILWSEHCTSNDERSDHNYQLATVAYILFLNKCTITEKIYRLKNKFQTAVLELFKFFISLRILGQQTPWSALHSCDDGQSLLLWQFWVTSPIRRGFPRSHWTVMRKN